jgi:hypothetical protein
MTIPGRSPEDQSKLLINLHFLKRDPKYDTIKPYTCRFDTQGKFPYTNIENVKHTVSVSNIRPILNEISLQRQGFSVMTIPPQMSYEDFNNDEIIRAVHIPHILTTFQNELKAVEIHVLDYRVTYSAIHARTMWY